MEYTSRGFKKVHIVQPGFLASDLLSIGIENFMKTGVTSPRFLFAASKRAIIDHESYFNKDFLKTLSEVRHDLKGHREQLKIEPRIGIRLLGSGALRFQVIPVDQVAFQESLDEIDNLPQSPQKFIGPQRHFLQATVSGNLLGNEEEMNKAAKALRERLTNKSTYPLYTLQANDLIDINAEMPYTSE